LSYSNPFYGTYSTVISIRNKQVTHLVYRHDLGKLQLGANCGATVATISKAGADHRGNDSCCCAHSTDAVVACICNKQVARSVYCHAIGTKQFGADGWATVTAKIT